MYMAKVVSWMDVPIKSSLIVFVPLERVTPIIVVSHTSVLMPVGLGQFLLDCVRLLISITFVWPLPRILISVFP